MICNARFIAQAAGAGSVSMVEAPEQCVRTVRSLSVLRDVRANDLVVFLETEVGEQLALRIPQASFEAVIDNLSTYELDAFVHGEGVPA